MICQKCGTPCIPTPSSLTVKMILCSDCTDILTERLARVTKEFASSCKFKLDNKV